jgi:hypothetical protein
MASGGSSSSNGRGRSTWRSAASRRSLAGLGVGGGAAACGGLLGESGGAEAAQAPSSAGTHAKRARVESMRVDIRT